MTEPSHDLRPTQSTSQASPGGQTTGNALQLPLEHSMTQVAPPSVQRLHTAGHSSALAGAASPQMGPPETTVQEYPGEDRSWADELAHLMACIRDGTRPEGGLDDALAALDVVHRAYAQSGPRPGETAVGR